MNTFAIYMLPRYRLLNQTRRKPMPLECTAAPYTPGDQMNAHIALYLFLNFSPQNFT